MNLLTYFLHLAGSGAAAYLTARNLRDRQTRPNLLAGFQLAESGSVPFLALLNAAMNYPHPQPFSRRRRALNL